MVNINTNVTRYAILVFVSIVLATAFSIFYYAEIARAEGAITRPHFSAIAMPTVEEDLSKYDCAGKTKNECLKDSQIVKWLQWSLGVLSALVGVGAIIMTIVAGLQYSASRDNPQGVQAAKLKITNVVIGLAAYIFLWAFLNWLIPGGPF